MINEDGIQPEAGISLDLSITPPASVEQVIPTEIVAPVEQVIPTEQIVPAPEPVPVVPQINEADVLRTLSERLGREVKSFDEINQPQTELNPYVKQINEWAEKTGRPVEDWVKFNKDYSTMSDLDKAKEILELKYPSLTSQELSYELSKYTSYDGDDDDDVTIKSLELKKLVAEHSNLLEDSRLKFGEPVEGHNRLTPELQEQVEFAKSARESYEAEVNNQKNYEAAIAQTVNELTSYELKLSDDLSINYNLTPEDKKSLPEFLASMSHWYNADGTYNHKAITEDALRIKNFPTMIKMAYEQGVASGVDQNNRRENNITLDNPSSGSEQPSSAKGIVIEGNWKAQGVKAKFGRKH